MIDRVLAGLAFAGFSPPARRCPTATALRRPNRHGRVHGARGRPGHRALRAQQAPRGHDGSEGRQGPAVRARRDLPFRDGVRPPVNGMSWMDYIARHGYDVYLVDVRGYGRSTRPRK